MKNAHDWHVAAEPDYDGAGEANLFNRASDEEIAEAAAFCAACTWCEHRQDYCEQCPACWQQSPDADG